MTSALSFAFCLLVCSVAGIASPNILKRVITKNLVVNNGLDYGNWYETEYCLEDSYAYMVEAMFESYSVLHIDETAVNAVKLYCKKASGEETGYIHSKVGEKGEWKGSRGCPNGLMTGMRAMVLHYQGSDRDDVAVQNVEMQCNYGESTVKALDDSHIGVEIDPGEWSEWSHCDSDSAICGIEIRYQAPFLVDDTMGVSDISMYCCSVWKPPSDLASEN